MPRKRRTTKWFKPGVHTGWSKEISMEERRDLALDAHGGDILATARGLQALANVTTDKETKAKAASDAAYFYKRYRS